MIAKRAENLLFAFLVFGLAAASYGLAHHLAPNGGGACNINATISCDLVNRGPYSEIFGFPVSAIGIIGYLMIGIVAGFFLKEKDPLYGKLLLALCYGGVAFSLYLTYLEAFVIHGWCPICLTSLASIVGATLCAIMTVQKRKA